MRRSTRIAEKQKLQAEESEEDSSLEGEPHSSVPGSSSKGLMRRSTRIAQRQKRPVEESEEDSSLKGEPHTLVTARKQRQEVPLSVLSPLTPAGTALRTESTTRLINMECWIQCIDCLQWKRGKSNQEPTRASFHCGCRFPQDRNARAYFLFLDSPIPLMELRVHNDLWER